jgi:hypothetical protein
MRALILILSAIFFGCANLGQVGSYAGMDIMLGYGHNFGVNNGGSIGPGHGNFEAVSFDGFEYPDDTFNTSVTILLRPSDD